MTVEKGDVDVVCPEYEEDEYLEYVRKSDTPSFDLEEPSDSLFPSLLSPSPCWSATNFVIAEDNDDTYAIETEFVPQRNLNEKNSIKDVRVKFQDLSKPYLARITNNQNYLKFLHLVKGSCSETEFLS